MFLRSIVGGIFVALALLQAVSAIDISKYNNIRLEFSNQDRVLQTKLGDGSGSGFIGDFVVGQRYSDESVFRRIIDFDNPTNMVQSTTLNLSITRGVVHYVSARNTAGSYAVVCNDANIIGSSQGSISLRVPPNSRSTLTLVIAAHN